jgi:ribonuclease HI
VDSRGSQALALLKDFLSKPPVFPAPRKKEQLLLYLATTTHVVSTAIVVERQEDNHAYPVQRPVYFVSEVLSESKARYQSVQKLLYEVLITSRKLRHYFQEYSISVFTDYLLGDILRNQDATRRISKWVVELGALNIDFKPRTTIKSQALVDFMAEWRENQLPTPTERPEYWVMYFDDSLKFEGAGARVLLISPTGEQLQYVLQIFWKVSNNEAEYEALLHGLHLAASLGIKRLLVYGDSAVVINQVNKSWDRNKENMDAYCLEVRKLENKFYGLEFHHVVRDNNVAADVLSKLGSTRAQVPAGVFVHKLHAPSIPEPAPTTTDPASPPAVQEVDDRRGLATTLHRLHPRAEGSHGQKLGRATHSPDQVLCPSRGQALQAGCHFWSTLELCSLRRRQGHLGGDPQKRLQQPRVRTHAG